MPSAAGAQTARADTASASSVVASRPVPTRRVWGTVEDVAGVGVAGAVVRAAGTPGGVTSDSVGMYALPGLSAGIDTLRVTRPGYEPLTLTVIVPASGSVRVDLVLDEEPVPLVPVRIVLREPTGDRSSSTSSLETVPGEWVWDDDQGLGSGSIAGDVLGVLRASPGAALRPDARTEPLLGAGPGAPPVRVMVDGLPVFAPLHPGGLLSALTPELVGGLRLSDGTASARDGGALSGTLDARTREGSLQRPVWSGAISPVAMRAAWGVPMQFGSVHGDLLLATRHATTQAPSGLDADGMLADPWSDAGGVLSLRGHRTSVEIVALTSADRLHARLADAERSTAIDTSDGRGAIDVEGALRAPWHTSTVGAVWTQSVASGGRLEARVWRAEFGAELGSSLSRRRSAISDTTRSVGSAVDFTRGGTRVGASIENVRTAYVSVQSMQAASADSVLRQSVLRASPLIVATYAEHQWRDTTRARTAVVGLRASAALEGAAGPLFPRVPLLEPHVAIATPIAHVARLTLGYARTHQIVQSVWSTEPVLSQLAPVALPVAARAGGAPVLSGDVVSASVRAPITSRLILDVAAFGRDFHGMLVPAQGDAEAGRSAMPAIAVATGRSGGGSIMAQGDAAGLTWTASYRVARTVSSAPLALGLGRRAMSRDLALTIGAHVDRHTALHVDGWLGTSEHPAEGDALGRARNDDRDAAAESEVPITSRDPAVSAPSTLLARSAPYSRLDFTLDRQWSLGSLGALDGMVTLANALGHTNAALALPDPGEGAHAIRFTPRSLLLGIVWRQR